MDGVDEAVVSMIVIILIDSHMADFDEAVVPRV